MARAPGDDLTGAELPLAQRVGQRIRERRNALGLTLVQTAGTAGISVSHLSSVETGGNVPSLGILARIAAALDLSLNELLRDVGGGTAIRSEHIGDAEPGARVLSHDDLQLQIAVVVADPGDEGVPPLPIEGRETFVYVHQGAFEVTVDGDAYVLQAGDSLDADEPATMAWRGTGAARSVSVWALGPGTGT